MFTHNTNVYDVKNGNTKLYKALTASPPQNFIAQMSPSESAK